MKIILKNIIILSCIVFIGDTLFAKGLTLKSKDMIGQISINQVFDGFGCRGKNISPQLEWSNAPKETKSFAITIYDPDAPTGSGWWHWVVFDISKTTNQILSNASALNKLPKGTIQSKTDFGKSKFGGACPPKGSKAHTYITTIYALDIEKLGLKKNTNPALVGFMLNSHTIEKSSIVTYYRR
ncbi:Phospholipid-binding protein [hydrothermal vent metagenome]|uniref:Phospholipid-binding protein n=1 Tax=hydrothermal vent metagenome TaxID=652676 RepID=A0A3B1E6E8_9ZZZZ